jgi:cytochrome c peroxidase
MVACLGISAWVAGAAEAPTGHAPASAPVSRSFYDTPFERHPLPAALSTLGRQLFFDAGLSASGGQSCASCHDPAHGYGPPNDLAVQLAGAAGHAPGLRAVPSLRYRQNITPFAEHFFDNDGNDSEDQGPTGGLDWDGRASSAHAQAAGPLLSPFEMGNVDQAAAVARLAASASAATFRQTFGEHVFDQPDHAWNGLLWALEVFQQSPSDFYPYSSRYDEVLRGQASLSPAQARGLQAFNDPTKGNCAACHVSAVRRGAFPQFTDHGYAALGLPRNPATPANAQADYRDLGLCGPLRQDLVNQTAYCGMFRVPSLRNVALRSVFFHNGVIHRLDDAVRFYAQRDSHPERYYPRAADGGVDKFNDLPAQFQANVNHEAPFGAKAGGPDALTPLEVADIVSFLATLTDRDLLR